MPWIVFLPQWSLVLFQHFDGGKQLIRAIESIRAQTLQDFVVLIVDDGGGLPSDIPIDDRIFSVSLSRNYKIPGMVRNVGIRLSESKYVAFLDDDNTWTPDHLSVNIQELESGADIVYSAVRRSREDGTELDILAGPFDRKRFANETSWIDINAIVLRRQTLQYFSRLPRKVKTFPREDWEFVWRNSRRTNILHVPTVTVEYLVNENSYFTSWEPRDSGHLRR